MSDFREPACNTLDSRKGSGASVSHAGAAPSLPLNFELHATMLEKRAFKETTPESFAAAMKRLRGR
jgi:hypothetical protein